MQSDANLNLVANNGADRIIIDTSHNLDLQQRSYIYGREALEILPLVLAYPR